MESKDILGNTPLHVSAQHQQTRLVQILLEAGADPDNDNTVSLYMLLRLIVLVQALILTNFV